MLRASIYSIEPLTPEARLGLSDGIGMVAAYMGETIATKELSVRLPLNERGKVNPARIGFSKLDKLVELHLMAVPLDRGQDEVLGLAGIGRGWSFVDTSSDSTDVIRTTAAHEVAHALGFLLPGAKQADPESPSHCCYGSCIMHRKVMISVVEQAQAVEKEKFRRKFVDKVLRRVDSEPTQSRAVHRVLDQYDFCLPCKVDIRSTGEEQVSKLRRNRILAWKGVR